MTPREPIERDGMTEPHKYADRPYGERRMTPQRRLVVDVAEGWPGAFTVDELSAAVRSRERTSSVATVYRAVSALAENGWLERVGDRNGSALFARCAAGTRHHHHVVCDGCGRVEAAECPVVAHVSAGDVAGFVITRHDVTLYGLCPDCADGKVT